MGKQEDLIFKPPGLRLLLQQKRLPRKIKKLAKAARLLSVTFKVITEPCTQARFGFSCPIGKLKAIG